LKRRSAKIFHRHSFKAMGSPCEIQLFAKNKVEAKRVTAIAIADVERLEALYSRYRSTSFLSEINRIASIGGSIEVDAETAGLLNYAATCFEESDGLFDITSGILRKAWHFDRHEVPDEKKVQSLLHKVGWQRLRWKPPLLEFPVSGMEIDFGGVVKEYAADRAAALCRTEGVLHGVVNLGGDIKIIGGRPDGSPWRIGVQHPRSSGEYITHIVLREGGVASSGDYERCIKLDGQRYGHVLNPTTGWPVKFMASVTIVSDLCMLAGSASTIAMLKESEGPTWLETLGVPHFWVNVDGHSGGSLATPFAIGSEKNSHTSL